MRLSEWRASAPTRDAMTLKVLAVIEPVLAAMGADPDPYCWVAWGDDPSIRYSILVPIAPGLVTCVVRVSVPGEGPRASAKLVRWSRVQLGELAVETQAGHRLVTFQVEQHVLRGGDAVADRIGGFALALFAAVDGRPMPDLASARSRRGKVASRASARGRARAKAGGSRAKSTPAATSAAAPSDSGGNVQQPRTRSA